MTPEQMKIEDERHLKALERIVHHLAGPRPAIPDHRFGEAWRARANRDIRALRAVCPRDYAIDGEHWIDELEG
jgi:hypothetical protein